MNPTYLIELVGGDRSVAREILGDFVQSDAEDRAQLAIAIAAGDSTAVHMYAHRIKGAARSIGADDYADLAEIVEQGATAGKILSAEAVRVDAAGLALADWASRFE